MKQYKPIFHPIAFLLDHTPNETKQKKSQSPCVSFRLFPTEQYASNLNQITELKHCRSILYHVAFLFRFLESMKMQLLPLKKRFCSFKQKQNQISGKTTEFAMFIYICIIVIILSVNTLNCEVFRKFLVTTTCSISGNKFSVSLGTVDDDTVEILDEINTNVEKKRKKTTSKTSEITKKPTSGKKNLVVPHDEHGRWFKRKAISRRQFREEVMQGRLPGRAVCLEGRKKYPHALKWRDSKDKKRNKIISDARK